ncbi:uncharacterized protein G2W53_011576 [Senna tora]|uniref:Uncharacterized protein n=1 Tax=Senna tora TaxID=362788 RepID=A0A835CFC4_9FABA|nr:uncharacterized protein G2W53_011576 [Senna tora]
MGMNGRGSSSSLVIIVETRRRISNSPRDTRVSYFTRQLQPLLQHKAHTL